MRAKIRAIREFKQHFCGSILEILLRYSTVYLIKKNIYFRSIII